MNNIYIFNRKEMQTPSPRVETTQCTRGESMSETFSREDMEAYALGYWYGRLEGTQLRLRFDFDGYAYDKTVNPHAHHYKQGYEAGVVAYHKENLQREYEDEDERDD